MFYRSHVGLAKKASNNREHLIKKCNTLRHQNTSRRDIDRIWKTSDPQKQIAGSLYKNFCVNFAKMYQKADTHFLQKALIYKTRLFYERLEQSKWSKKYFMES